MKHCLVLGAVLATVTVLASTASGLAYEPNRQTNDMDGYVSDPILTPAQARAQAKKAAAFDEFVASRAGSGGGDAVAATAHTLPTYERQQYYSYFCGPAAVQDVADYEALYLAAGAGALAADPSRTPEPTDTPGPSWPALTEAGPWPTPALLSQAPDLALDIHALPGAWALHSGPFVASDGTEMTWSAVSGKDPEGQPFLGDIVAFAPLTDLDPVVIYHDPEPDARIWDTAVRDGRYAFVETNERLLGTGWRLWAFPGRGSDRVLLDTNDGPDAAPTPSFVLTDDRIIWTAVHPRDDVLAYEIRSARFDGTNNHALLSSPVAERQYWYPSLDPTGTHLLFATVEPVGSDWRYRIWSLDLTAPGAQPVRLGTSNEATQPLTNGSVLSWRIVDGNVQVPGKDMVMADPDGSDPMRLNMPSSFLPTLGNRYLAEQDQRHELVVYDLAAGGALMVIERFDNAAGWVLQRGWTMVAGDLLIFRPVVYDDEHAPGVQIAWAILPPAPQQ